MTTQNRQYTENVKAGLHPLQVELPLDDRFDNHNGSILNVLFANVQSVARIESCQDAIRANHWHRTDDHYTYVEKGAVIYLHRPVGSKERPSVEAFAAGRAFYTPSMVEHAMVFPVETVIWTFARNVRDHQHHESDVVRVELVTREAANMLTQAYRAVG